MSNFPRVSKYDFEWMKANMMGPNSIFLLERLSTHLNLREGMRVLDLGCGRGITSVFLAKEFGVQVWATDLWIAATDNYERFIEAGVADRVFPIHAEAHELPYADGFFDAAVVIDAYSYFGTEDEYLDKHLAPLIKSGGEIGIVVPGLSRDLDEGEIPRGLESIWDGSYRFPSAQWWENLWDNSQLVDVQHVENMPDGKKIWYESIWQQGQRGSDFDRKLLRADKDDMMTMIMMTAVKK